MSRNTLTITRAQAHAMLDVWWNPRAVDQLLWRHKAIDRLFDAAETAYHEAISRDPLYPYPDTWEDTDVTLSLP